MAVVIKRDVVRLYRQENASWRQLVYRWHQPLERLIVYVGGKEEKREDISNSKRKPNYSLIQVANFLRSNFYSKPSTG